MDLALAPLDAAIKELTWMLGQLGGEARQPPEYSVFRRQQPQQQESPANVAQFQPHRQGVSQEPPPASFVKSPKSGTPIPTNEGILRRALKRG